ncbi:MAG: pyridoxal-phosphate dependent enzyme [Chloroflexota bacterium]|nr:pyridoxal-phosphate dependent enzyme [Chloroflexota bacterium]MDE2948009.1 pyridoxal-phosphate dependent enzyme [Chloroflexota bacterium]
MIPLEAIQQAAERLRARELALRTPLLRLHVEDGPAEIYLKLENIQPIGSFKLRGAGNAMARAGAEALAKGVYTASAGNMAQGVAWNARRLGLPCSVIVPDHAPETKLTAIRRLGGEVIKVPFARWWEVIVSGEFDGLDGRFIHPVRDGDVMAGNGTIGLEILEDLPAVDAVLIPYGGGGLSVGIASAIRALKPDTRLYAVEVETAAPLAASLRAGRPVEVEYMPSFVDGIGGKSVLPEIWPLAWDLLDGSLVASLEAVRAAIRLLAARGRLIAEGAGAAPLAAALAGMAGGGKVACVVSGGNIDATVLAGILAGE